MKIAVFMNSAQLGGGEKSIILQMRELQKINGTVEVTFVFPEGDISNECSQYLREHITSPKFLYINLDPRFTQLSRSGRGKSALFQGLQGFICSLIGSNKEQFSHFDILWCNGNKVAALMAFIHAHYNYQNRIIWHLRDYCPSNSLLHSIFRLNSKIEFIANSYSVADELSRTYLKEARVIYNPVLPNSNFRKREKVQNIAIASMHAPWKGIHEVIRMAQVYEQELLEVGIEKINIYGDMIYQTSGDHSNYSEQLRNIANGSKLVQFCGLRPSKEIFSDNDLLIHSSLLPEPFGRVLLEAFQNGLPVISTALGGAGELVIPDETGYIYAPHDIHGLFARVKDAVEGVSRENMLTNALKKSEEIKEQYQKALKEII